MKTFKSITDVEQLRNHPLRDTLEKLVVPVVNKYTKYRPENDVILLPCSIISEQAFMRRKFRTNISGQV